MNLKHLLQTFVVTALLFCLSGISSEVTAQAPANKPGRPTETIVGPGDPAKGEDKVTMVFYDNKIVRFLETVVIDYKNGSRQALSYRQDGTLSESEERNSGGGITSTYYQDDGIRKTKASTVEVTILPKGGFNILTKDVLYNDDGETVKSTRTQDRTGDLETEDFDKNGTLRIKKVWGSDKSTMDATVYDLNGKESYSQHWKQYKQGNRTGYNLQSMTETTAKGHKRRVITKDLGPKQDSFATPELEQVEYLKADGSVDKVEKPDALSEPVDDERLRPVRNF